MRISEGDENAFAQLFKSYYNLLADFILRITESKPLTQEIVQDVFLKIWINRTTLPGIDCFKAYLLVVARNQTFNCLKQMAREKNRQKAWEHTVLQQALGQEDELVGADTTKLIEEAIELLPPQQKHVYILSRREGVPQETIAKQLNISHQTVKKHMVLALRFLKNHIRTNTNFILFIIVSLSRS